MRRDGRPISPPNRRRVTKRGDPSGLNGVRYDFLARLESTPNLRVEDKMGWSAYRVWYAAVSTLFWDSTRYKKGWARQICTAGSKRTHCGVLWCGFGGVRRWCTAEKKKDPISSISRFFFFLPSHLFPEFEGRLASPGILPEHLNRGHITSFLSLRPPIPVLMRY